ncbi:hypothetical protein NBRC116592_16700 [Colwellia sp. KU-HH00111]
MNSLTKYESMWPKLVDHFIKLKCLSKGYYSTKYNREFKFEQSLLEQLGFKPCVCCKK